MSSEEAKTNYEILKEKFPPGTRIVYNAAEYVVAEVGGTDDDPIIYAIGDLLNLPGERFNWSEYEVGEFEIDRSPEFKFPVRTEYPAQVFVFVDERTGGVPSIEVFGDLNKLKERGEIDGDSIMEAISDPGTIIEAGEGRTLVFAAIEGGS